MAIISANFEAGVNGNAVTTAAGEASATKWDSVGLTSSAAVVYDNTHVRTALAAKLSTTGTGGAISLNWSTAFGTQTDHYGCLDIYITGNPASNVQLVTFFNNNGFIRLRSDGKISLHDSANTQQAISAAAIPTNQWVRLEWHAIHSTTVGQLEVKIYANADVPTLTETVTTAANLNMGSGSTSVRVGSAGNIANLGPFWLDNIAELGTAYFTNAQTAPAAAATAAASAPTFTISYTASPPAAAATAAAAAPAFSTSSTFTSPAAEATAAASAPTVSLSLTITPPPAAATAAATAPTLSFTFLPPAAAATAAASAPTFSEGDTFTVPAATATATIGAPSFTLNIADTAVVAIATADMPAPGFTAVSPSLFPAPVARDADLRQLRIVVKPLSGQPREYTPLPNTLHWSTNSLGGFGSAAVQIAGERLRDFPYLAEVQITYGTTVLWEGRIEDRGLRMSGPEWNTTVEMFGYWRILETTGVSRAWSIRSFDWTEVDSTYPFAVSCAKTLIYKPVAFKLTVGAFDKNDATRIGLEIRGIDGTTTRAGEMNAAIYRLPPGITAVKLLFTATKAEITAGTVNIFVQDSVGGATWTSKYCAGTAGAQTVTLSAGATHVVIGTMITVADVINENLAQLAYGQIENIRLLCTSLNEDVTNGFYGGTLLTDLVGQLSGVTAGVIEAGSDFSLDEANYTPRQSAADICRSIGSYYTREYGVWDDKKLNWTTPDLNAAGYIVPTAELSDFDATWSTDKLARTVYIEYDEAGTGIKREASAVGTDQRNPFVKAGVAKDEVLSAGTPMSSTSATQLANKAIADHGAWVPVTGTAVLSLTRIVRHATLGPRPAFLIRSGDNITIPDLPKPDGISYGAGRDGATLFHIVNTDIDPVRSTITLQLEGQLRRTEVLLARLAAKTKTVTG